MFASSWLRIRHPSDAGRRDRARVKPAASRPRVEGLEGRRVPSTLTVTNTLDSGHGSLRYEIAQAEKNHAKDAIVFNISKKDPGYNSSTGIWTIALTTGELDITQNLTIQGPGASLLTISGDLRSRIFEVAPNVTAALSGLTISGGEEVASALVSHPYDGDGGGILNAGTLTLTGCTVSGNNASGNVAAGGGGGIYNTGTLIVGGNSVLSSNWSAWNGGGVYNAGTLAVNDSRMSGNTSNGEGGGGIYNSGALTVSDSSMSGNEAVLSGGGAILNTGTLLVSNNSTLSGNSADSGGAIDNEGTATIDGSTISGNSSPVVAFSPPLGRGGGIFNNGTLTVSNCNLSDNSVSSGGEGGGIYNYSGGATLTISNSHFSGNIPDNIFGSYIDGGGNTFG